MDRSSDPAWLRYQYGDSEKLRIRIHAHQRFSERPDDWHSIFVEQLQPAPRQIVLDVGCGFGAFHPRLCATGARVLGMDTSAGMLQEASDQARRLGLSAQLVRADAQALPVASASCDALLASHMLFHVPDIPLALREMRRVLKRGGRVLVSTNAADHSWRLMDLHARAAHAASLTPTDEGGHRRFSLAHEPLVRAAFPNVQVYPLPNAFLFPTVEDALRYYASARVDSVAERQTDGSHRPRLLARMAELIGEIIQREGVFRVPKDAGYFLATGEA